jgi:hypothetical protein
LFISKGAIMFIQNLIGMIIPVKEKDPLKEFLLATSTFT